MRTLPGQKLATPPGTAAGAAGSLPANMILRAGALGLALVLGPAAGSAQNITSYISRSGSDGNDCSELSPCLGIVRAQQRTANGGSIRCLDAAQRSQPFLPITQSLTIDCTTAPSTYFEGFTIDAPDVVVILRGLDIYGAYQGVPSTNRPGVDFVNGNALLIENCKITAFGRGPGIGIWFRPTGTSRLYVTDSMISENGLASSGGGIVIQPSGAGSARATINRSVLNQNTYGIFANGMGSTGVIIGQIKDSTISGSIFNNISAFTSAGHSTTSITVDRSSSLLAGDAGILAQGPSGFVILGNSTVMSNATGLQSVDGGNIFTYQNNQLTGNASNGAPTAMLGVR